MSHALCAGHARRRHTGKLALDKLRETVSSVTCLEADGEVGPFWSVRAARPGRPPKWILFERTERGEWKITGF